MMKIKGLDALQKKLSKMEQAAHDLEGTHTYSADELFTRAFMLKHTSNQFASFDSLVKAGNFGELSFSEIPDADWEKWVVKATDFSSWKEMQSTAVKEHIAKSLGF